MLSEPMPAEHAVRFAFVQDETHSGGILDEVDEQLTADDGTLADPYADAEAGHYATAWYEDTNLWVLVAFVVVVALLLSQGIGKRVTSALTARADTIRGQLDEARSLREEAQSLLADYQKRQREAEEEAQAIIDQAKADAKALTAEAHRKAEASLARRTDAAHARIARAEAQAVAEIQGEAARLSVAAAREIIADQAGGETHRSLTDRAIAEVGHRLS